MKPDANLLKKIKECIDKKKNKKSNEAANEILVQVKAKAPCWFFLDWNARLSKHYNKEFVQR